MATKKDEEKNEVEVKESEASKEQGAKQKAVRLALDQIEKQFGTGSIMKMGEVNKVDVDVVPTGSLSLDLALGVGGIPRG